MKQYLIYILFLNVVFACQDFNLSPEHQLSDESLWNDSEHFRAGVNILYQSIGTHDNYLDNDSDFSYGLGSNNVSNGSRDVPASSSFYNDSYRDIRRCNFIIERAIDNGFENNRYVAEARWFRSLFYFRLVKSYGDVPFYTNTLDPSSEELFEARTPRNEVVDFILQELEEVADLLPEQSTLASTELGRITKGAANALRARVALFEGTWIKYHGTSGDANERFDVAIESAEEVINSGEYELFRYDPKLEESYRYFFMEVGNDSKEQIVARRYDITRSHNFNNRTYEGIHSSTRKLADMYLCLDGMPINMSSLFQGRVLMTSEFENRDPRMAMTIIKPGHFAIDRLDQEGTGADYPEFLRDQTLYSTYKHISEFYVDQTGHRAVSFYHMIRYAEVLLIYAEAIYERNSGITDKQLEVSINKLRERVGMPNLTNDFVLQNGLDMKVEIRRERSIELAHEGFRRDDLRRWKTAEIELPTAIKGVQFQNTEFESAVRDDGTLRYPIPPLMDTDGNVIVEAENNRSFRAERDYLDPIPSEELFKNPSLKQNPNW